MGKMGKCKGQFMSNLRERWTDPITARRVPSKWKRGARGILCTNLSTLCIYSGRHKYNLFFCLIELRLNIMGNHGIKKILNRFFSR
jgi:hypothetical protein